MFGSTQPCWFGDRIGFGHVKIPDPAVFICSLLAELAYHGVTLAQLVGLTEIKSKSNTGNSGSI